MTETQDPGLLRFVPSDVDGSDLKVWIKEGVGFIGWGTALRLVGTGTDQLAKLSDKWRHISSEIRRARDERGVSDPVVAFVSGVFDDSSSDSSVLTVPRHLIKIGDESVTQIDCSWLMELRAVKEADSTGLVDQALADPYIMSKQQWLDAVGRAKAEISAGSVEKVVLARSEVAPAKGPTPVQAALDKLIRSYSSCWVFAVEGLVGATPELLAGVEGSNTNSRVLAGSEPLANGADTSALAEQLRSSNKMRDEHEFAVASAVESMSKTADVDRTASSPFVLELPNVLHLASDLEGRLQTPDSSVIDVASVMHPTAAVCGTPTAAAFRLISELEKMDRGRYTGPVGWVDDNGDGELAIAIRCAQYDHNRGEFRLFAGCGLVSDSDPDLEYAESEAKMKPMRLAVGVDKR